MSEDEKPVYQSAIWEIERGWSWRVEIDVRNGRSWAGHTDFYEEAVAVVNQKLLIARKPDPKPEPSIVRFARVMEEYRAYINRSGRTLAEIIGEMDRIRSRTRD